MLELYKYMVDNNMKKLSAVPEPYQRMMREQGYTDEPSKP
jgi:hypothetical protein